MIANTVVGDGIEVRYALPKTPGRVAAIVLCAGMDSPGLDEHRLTQSVYLQNGLAVFAFDYYGIGNSKGTRKLGTYGIWADNLKSVLHFVTSLPTIDTSKIGLRGVSSGSTVAIRYLLENENDIAFLISKKTCIGLHLFKTPPARDLAVAVREAIRNNSLEELQTLKPFNLDQLSVPK